MGISCGRVLWACAIYGYMYTYTHVLLHFKVFCLFMHATIALVVFIVGFSVRSLPLLSIGGEVCVNVTCVCMRTRTRTCTSSRSSLPSASRPPPVRTCICICTCSLQVCLTVGVAAVCLLDASTKLLYLLHRACRQDSPDDVEKLKHRMGECVHPAPLACMCKCYVHMQACALVWAYAIGHEHMLVQSISMRMLACTCSC